MTTELPAGFELEAGQLPAGFALDSPGYASGLEGVKERAEDVMARVADSASFGLATKGRAALQSAVGNGTYDDNLKKYRQEVADAGQRLGWAGSLASDVAGGLGVAGPLTRAGLTLAGRVPASASLLTKARAGAIEGAGYGAAYGAGNTDTGNVADYLRNAGKGALTGAALGATVPVVAGGVARAITPAPAESAQRLAAARTLQDAGVPLYASQVTGSRNLATLENAAEKMPMGQWFVKNPATNQMDALTAAAAQKAGITGPVTEDALVAARQSIGNRIGGIQSQFHIDGNDVLQGLSTVAQDIPLLQPGHQATANWFVNKLLQPSIAPREAQTLRTQLTKAIGGQNGINGDPTYRGVLQGLKETLDDGLAQAIQKSGQPELLDALQGARQQYANLHVLQDALMSSGQSGQLGKLTPTALQNAQARSIGRSNYMQGRGDLTDLAKAAAAVLPRNQGSGTAERNLLYRTILDPIKLAASIPANAAINSRPAQAYLSNQVLPGSAGGGLLGPATGGAVGGYELSDPRRFSLLGQLQ